MKSLNHGFQSGEEGKGSAGCLFALVLMAIIVFLSLKLAPPYFHFYDLKSALKQEVSRVGARITPDEVIVQDLIKIGEKSKVSLTKDNIKIIRIPSQITIEIEYKVPINLIIYEFEKGFKMEGSSFTAG